MKTPGPSTPPDSPAPIPPRQSKPWLWVIVAFVLLIAAWTTLIVIARRHEPQYLPPPPRASP